MCGIAGIIYTNSREKNSSPLHEMLRILKHRGPDGTRFNIDTRVGMGMTRLSIIDVSGGMQPLYNEDKSIEIIGNGEIYNYIELQKKLSYKSHRLRTGSGIETAIHLYEDLDLDFVNKLRGMFALALYDRKKQKLILVRDRFGEKPIYYYESKDFFAFASELKAILSIKGVTKDIDFGSIDAYFHHNYIPEPATPFTNVKKLKAGSILIFDLKSRQIKIEKYNDFSLVEPTTTGDPSLKILKVLKESCKLTLRSDVPVGIALSGGLDSGSILALSAPFYKDKMKAFTIGYEGAPKSDERGWALYLANKFNVEQFFDEIKTSEFVKDFPQLVYDADDPIADIAGYAIYRVARLARENNIKVILGGLGGDELFWGYSWVREITQKNINNSFKDTKPFFYEKVRAYKNAKQILRRIYSNDFYKEVRNNWVNREVVIKNPLKNARFNMNKIRDSWLVSNCVALNDRLSMASSVELRSPLLDYKLAELAYSTKENVMAYEKGNKFYLRKALKDIIPEKYLNLPKRGFNPPVASWFFALINRYGFLIKDGFLVQKGILSKNSLKLCYPIMRVNPMLWDALFQLLVLEVWGREYVLGQKPGEMIYAEK